MSATKVRPIKARSFVGEMTVERFETKIRPFIDRIQTLRQKIRSSKEFKSWHRDVESLLCFSFGDDSAQTKGFWGVSYSPPMWSSATPESFFDKCFYSGLDDAEVYLNNVLNEVLEYFPKRNAPSSGELDRCAVEVSKDVFIVHGHDEQLLLEVEKAIIALDLNPVVLREQPNEGMTLIQKFEKKFSDGVEMAWWREACQTGEAVV